LSTAPNFACLLPSAQPRLSLRIEKTKSYGGCHTHKLSQVARADYSTRAEYKEPISARSDLEMVRKLTEVHLFVESKEFAPLPIVRAAQEKSLCEVRGKIRRILFQPAPAPVQDGFRTNLERRQQETGGLKCGESCDGRAFAKRTVRAQVKDKQSSPG
jgi:hypothetical protein